MKLRELQKEFEKKGIKYTQLIRNLYDVTDEKCEIKKDGYLIYKCEDIDDCFSYYEVFRYRLIPPHPYSNEDYDMIESYPTENQFGLSAWCCSNVECVKKVMKKHFMIDYDVLELL